MRRFRVTATAFALVTMLVAVYGCDLFSNALLASFSVTPSSGSAPLTVQVDASASLDPGGGNLTFQWNFGDGSFGLGVAATHTYNASGQYTIRLTVTNDQGQQTSIVQTVWVLEATEFPEAAFTASPSSGGTPLTVAFNAAASSDSNGTISSYVWSFGDGSTGSGVSAIHTYSAQGSYTAMLTVTDNDGFSDSMSMLIVVIDGGQGGCS